MKQKAMSILRENGFKITLMRCELICILLKSAIPMSVSQIVIRFKKKPDLVSVYRALNDFVCSNIVERVHLGKREGLYKISKTHHHHIVCKDCGVVENFSMCQLAKIINVIEERSKYFNQITNHSFDLFGFCKQCAKK